MMKHMWQQLASIVLTCVLQVLLVIWVGPVVE
jgi:hypothetical protein